MSFTFVPFGSLYAEPVRNGLTRPTSVRGDGYRMVNMGELFAYDRIADQEMERVKLNERELQVATLEVGDLLFARSSLKVEGTGKCSIVQFLPEITTFESHLIRVRLDRNKADPSFYFYFFQSYYGRATVLSIAKQVGAAGLPGSKLAGLSVPQPEPITQSRIADILSAYDDLIENNRRRMELLEEAARQLYQEWFVRLRFPGYEHSKIVDGVPSGWKQQPISALTTFLRRGITPHYDDEADGLVINQKCIRNGRVDLALARRQSREYSPDRKACLGDVLVNSTGEGTLGRVGQVLMAPDNCTVDSHVTIVRPMEEVGKHYFGLAVRAWEPRFSTMGRGATNQTELSPAQIGAAELLIPSQLLQTQFEEFSGPIFRQIVILTEQNQKLSAARDLLLPRLMSGEITV